MAAEVFIVVIVFLAIGAIVSLDVAGLTLSKIGTFAEEGRSIPLWALTNAVWHAGLLFVYILVIAGIFKFSFAFFAGFEAFLLLIIEQVDFLKVDLRDYVQSLFALIREHARLILGMISLYIVWWTYSEKIVGVPTLGRSEELSTFPRTIYDLLEICVRFLPVPGRKRFNPRIFLRWQAQAALVAVDMLALAALMKAMGYLETTGRQVGLVVLVFALVFAITLAIGFWGRRKYFELQTSLKRARKAAAAQPGAAPSPAEDAENARDEARQRLWDWLIISLRLLEPWMIFYFALELMSFLIIGERVHSLGFLLGSTLLLLGLIKKHSLLTIVQRCFAQDEIEAGLGEGEPLRDLKDFREDFAALIFMVLRVVGYVVGLVLLIIAVTVVFYPTPESFISLDTEISRLMGALTLLTLVLFFIGKKIEIKVYAFFHALMDNRHTFLFILSALILAALVPIYEKVTSAAVSGVALSPDDGICSVKGLEVTANHIHSLQIVIWLTYFSVVGLLLEASDRKHKIVEGKRLDGGQCEFSRQFVGAILLASGIIFFAIGHMQEFLREVFLPCFPTAGIL